MLRSFRRYCLLAALAAASLPAPVQQQQTERAEEREIKLPNGKSQREEILKYDHEKNLKDSAALAELAAKLKQELEENDRHVLSVGAIRKTEEIEKIAKRIRSRLRRF
jgi:ATP-dependent helicase/DNAse subunit B